MASRRSSSQTSHSSHSIYQAHFPRAEGPPTLSDVRSLPLRPRSVGPVFDKSLASQPIAEFDPSTHDLNYAKRDPTSTIDEAPAHPEDFQDHYLMPSLTENERLRLTLFWYYTHGSNLLEDKDFLLGLQQKLDLVQTFMGWEFAIMGLLSEHVYTRVATAGLPLAILPRRESTCSHTINQPPGSVFMLPNMASDWRFKGSPHVEEGGLRSYAGAMLRCKADTGEDIALGSLCIASNSERPPLTSSQQDALVRFADMMASEIVSRAREARRRQRQVMADLVAQTHQFNSAEDVKNHVFKILTQVYPGAIIDIQEALPSDTIILPHHAPACYEDFQDGLWEDTELVERLIVTQNHTQLSSESTVRAIVHPCQKIPITKYLILSSTNVQLVFDDVDSWFVEKCAMLMADTVQESRLRDALTAKEAFLRGITHQLRTPIHGVLGSCELLFEELSSRDMLSVGSSGLNPSSVLSAIRDSGRELMSTVNNMLKLNRWAEDAGGSIEPASLLILNHIEADIIYEVNQSIPEHELSEISIMFENRLGSDDSMIVMDLSLLKECIQALIQNALSYTDRGAVIVVISASSDYTRLTFDIKDTGRGIPLKDQERIFEAYEKVDTHTRGAGLGLTLSAKIANAMNGTVSLVSSKQNSPDHGSLFRAEFLNPGFACPIPRPIPFGAGLKDIPRKFHVVPPKSQRPELVLHFASYLEHRGFEDAETPEDSLIILTYTPDADEFRNFTAALDTRHVALCLTPAGATTDKLHGAHEVRFFSGPFLTTRLEEITTEIDSIYKRLNSDPEAGETATGLANQNDAHRTSGSEDHTDPAAAEPMALLVDDNLVNLRIMRMYCEKRKIKYSTAMDGAEAVAVFEKAIDTQPINLILMDLQMPVCDGIEATQRIRQMEKEKSLARAALFIVTGQDSVADKKASYDAGADEFFVKPLGLKTLDKGIKEYFPAALNVNKTASQAAKEKSGADKAS
ncbi:hypothetical protein D6D27_08047 [Aureobasidium pullulans]|uniref:histidine kinase n=1 Tax=Aureobasidium pullulans TaxID=5580 RepID=A0A4S8TKC5_AURPU|nr:hypothetical protein D6D27_08047 [Aureobasidium pullulans]THW51761.1 hypothetical protein D6D22_00632 [Aureobasidium pullulans]THX81880.1 hypothetical protein D6D08_04845 [Aureobasidium pullulans]